MDFNPVNRRKRKSVADVRKTPKKDEANMQEEPRSSSRIQQKRDREFQMPSREDVWKNISDEPDVKAPGLVQPRRLADSFSRVTHSYNKDRFETYETSDESDVDDFINDSDDSMPMAPVKVKKKGRKQRLSSSSSIITSSSDEEAIMNHQTPKKKANRLESDASDSQNQSSDTEEYDVESDKKSDIKTKTKTPIKKSKLLIDGSESDEYEFGHKTTPYKNKNRIESDSSDSDEVLPICTKVRSKTYITGETNTEFEDSELDDLVVDCLRMYYKYNAKNEPKIEDIVKTGLFDAVDGTEQREVEAKPVIRDTQESQEYSVGGLADLSDESEGEGQLMSPKNRPRADRKVALREKFHDYKEARRKPKPSHTKRKSGSETTARPPESTGTCTNEPSTSKTSSYGPHTPTKGVLSTPLISYTETPKHTSSLSSPPASSTTVTKTGGNRDLGAANSNECSVCLENSADCAFYTCGHMCACYNCAQDIFTNGDKLCPICRVEIKEIMKIYKS